MMLHPPSQGRCSIKDPDTDVVVPRFARDIHVAICMRLQVVPGARLPDGLIRACDNSSEPLRLLVARARAMGRPLAAPGQEFGIRGQSPR